MTEPKTFEDQFDHDPDTVYDPEEDLDLGPDDEFSGNSETSSKSYTSAQKDVSQGGCLGGLLKVALSSGLILFCYLYIFQPEKFTVLQNKITQIFSADSEERLPLLSMSEQNIPQSPVQPQMPVSIPNILLNGAGTLPDFSTVAKHKTALNFYLIEAEKIRFETLDTYHNLLKNMINDWTGETEPEKIEQIINMPYTQFFTQTSVSLLSQTVLKQIGLTPTGNARIVSQDPIQVMASVYPHLKKAMSEKTTVRDQLKTIEPISSFLIHICRGSVECLASWDLLIDMLGVKKYAQILEKSPENIYRSSGN